MNKNEDLTFSENKTKNTLYKVIGRKISESRKSSRRKLDGISKKLNISVEILKKIEAGDIEDISKEIPLTGFVRAFAKITNSDITDEIEKLQSDYFVEEKPKSIYEQVPVIKTSKILVVFILSFCFILLLIYFLNFAEKQSNKKLKSNKITSNSFSYDDEISNAVDDFEFEKLNDENFKDQVKMEKIDDSFFEIIFLEDTWIEVYNEEKTLVESGLFKIGDILNFNFSSPDVDYFIKSGNLGGFQIFFRDEFFAPFGYSGEVNRGFYVKEKILKIINTRLDI